jgi:hypothetical protein
LNFPKTDSEYIQWIKFSKDIFSDEFLLGCVYIPPENSKYSTIDAFTEIENEFISLNTIVIPPDFLQTFCLHLENDLYPFAEAGGSGKPPTF